MNCSSYSGLVVLASVESIDGKIYGGSNVETVTFSLTIHAEQAAILAALHDGVLQRLGPQWIRAIYITSDIPTLPCGACRQFAMEWANEYTLVACETPDGNEVQWSTLFELLPDGFRPEALLGYMGGYGA
jgi:cytidine deaminase